MYQAKTASATPIAVYVPAMSSRLRDWLELETRLRRAVQEERINLLFQPKFNLKDQRLSGVEALLRWCDDEHGEVSPNRFIEIAEDSGLILEMGSWVVRAACRQLRKWLDAGFSVPVAINVSGKEFLHGDPALSPRDRRLAACKDAIRRRFGFTSLLNGTALVLAERHGVTILEAAGDPGSLPRTPAQFDAGRGAPARDRLNRGAPTENRVTNDVTRSANSA